MMRKLLLLIAVALFFLASSLVLGQVAVPEIAYDAVDLLRAPNEIPVGEIAGVASNSRGNVFVYSRTGTVGLTAGTARVFAHGGSSRLYQFDQNGKFLREIGQGLYPLVYAQSVRVDPQDNVWVVDQYSNMVVKFDPEGRVAMTFGRKPETARVQNTAAAAALAGRGAAAGGAAGRGAPAVGGGGGIGGRGAPGAGTAGDSFNRPTDVAWDAAGNIFVADGFGNSRILKMDKDGRFVKTFGSRGSEPGQFNMIASIATDARGNIYVADRGNNRIQVLDNDGNFKSQITGIGTPQAICISPGQRQYLYSSNSNDPDNLENGEIYKIELDGKIVGKFGKAGHMLKEFGTVNSIDCRTENVLLVGELINWRVQKVTLKAK